MERILDELIASGLTRRRLLGRAGAGALSIGAISVLAACGGDDDDGGGSEEAKAIAKGEISDTLYVANWPLYIDVDEDDEEVRPTIEQFKKDVGVRTLKYVEEINDNTEFFGKVRQQYETGNSGGRDIHVVTDWMASRMKQLGYVLKLDKSEMPNVTANLLDTLKSPGFDPTREFSVPWQSGMTGIVYRQDLTGGELTSINELFDPKFKGKVTMLTEMRDTVGLVMAADGKDPEKFEGTADAMAAIEKIDKASKDGQIRRFTGNDFTKDLLSGDTVACIGWSGDSVQLQADNEDIRFAMPEEGFHLWTDNMQVPVGAPHAYTAQKWMDFYYQPEVQAKVAAYVNYVTPVKGAREELAKTDPDTADNELIFPPDDLLAQLSQFDSEALDNEDYVERWQQVLGA
jgi:spermidine/putrescine transport system substrate-binding protein